MDMLGTRQRIAKLTVEMTYPDGRTVRLDGTNLLADAGITLPDYPVIDAQDIAPMVIAPRPAEHFTLDITLDLHGKLTLNDVPPADGEQTPWKADRNRAERTGKWPESWGPFHRHFANDAVHRDGGPECDQPGTPRRVYVFDPEHLGEHELIVARYAVAHPEQFEPPTATP